MKKFLLTLGLLSLTAESKIFMDYEADPLPLVKINILVPASRITTGDKENLALKFMEEFYESGTQKLSRQKFQDTMASFGASLEIGVGYQYADISATFPLSGGKIPTELISVVKDAWESPRINKENYERAKKHLRANHLSYLDRDNTLMNLGLQKVMATALFGLFPYSTDTFSKITLQDVEQLHKTYYKSNEIWVGVIGPQDLRKDISAMLQKLFPTAGDIQDGIFKQQLVTGYQPTQKGLLKPTFLIIDKKDLAQIHYGFMRISQNKGTAKTELTDKFSFYSIVGAGLDSVYGSRIREERGLSYVVSGMMDNYYEYPVISLYANPQRNKQAEAFEVLQNLINETFNEGRIISGLNDNKWAGWLLSYRNSERQSGATPEGRLGRRKSVVMGDTSYQLYNTPVDDWSVKKHVAVQRLKEFAASSTMIAAALGDATEVEPLVKKHFPTYEILKINYKDVINESWLKKK